MNVADPNGARVVIFVGKVASRTGLLRLIVSKPVLPSGEWFPKSCVHNINLTSIRNILDSNKISIRNFFQLR